MHFWLTNFNATMVLGLGSVTLSKIYELFCLNVLHVVEDILKDGSLFFTCQESYISKGILLCFFFFELNSKIPQFLGGLEIDKMMMRTNVLL